MLKAFNNVYNCQFNIIELLVFSTDYLCIAELVIMYFILIVIFVGAKVDNTAYQEDYSIVLIKNKIITLHSPTCFRSVSYEENSLLYSVSKTYNSTNYFHDIPKIWLDINNCVVKLDSSKLLKNQVNGLKLLEIKSKLGNFYETMGIILHIYISISIK